jgi:hypothetical protein
MLVHIRLDPLRFVKKLQLWRGHATGFSFELHNWFRIIQSEGVSQIRGNSTIGQSQLKGKKG